MTEDNKTSVAEDASDEGKPLPTISTATAQDQTQSKTASESKTSSAAQTDSRHTKPTQKSFTGVYLLSLLAILLIVALAYIGYLRYQVLEQQITLVVQTNDSLQNQVVQLQQQQINQQSDIQQKLQSMQAQRETDSAGFTDHILKLNESLSELSGKRDNGWLAEEALYLLRMANNRLVFMQDIDTTIYILSEVDGLLAQLDDPQLFVVRKKINQDRQQLSSLPKVDTTGLAIRVAALQSRVAHLPLVPVLEDMSVQEPVETQSAPQAWYEHLLMSVKQLGDQWFTVRHHGSGYSPLISQADEQQLRFIIMLTLQSIQYAILHHNDDLYQANLLQLKSRLNNYFDNEDPAVQTLLIEIEQLLQQPVGHTISEGLASLMALSNYVSQRQQSDTTDLPKQTPTESAENTTTHTPVVSGEPQQP